MKTYHSNPNILILMITYNCNLSCSFCPIEKENKNMSLKTAKNAVDLFLNYEVGEMKILRSAQNDKLIRFFGGEPLLKFSLIKNIIEYTKEKYKNYNIKFDLTTNGLSINKEIFDFIKGNEKLEVIFSYSQERKNLEILKKLKNFKNITVNLMIESKYVKYLSKDFLSLLKIGFKKFNLLPLYYIKWKKDEIEELKREFLKIEKLIKEREIWIKNVFVKNSIPLYAGGFVVDYNGDIFTSSLIISKDFSKIRNEIKIGNVKEIPCKFSFKNINYKNILKKNTPYDILSSSEKIDKVLTDFTQKIKSIVYQRTNLSLVIFLTRDCIFRCKYCFLKKEKKYINKKTLNKIINLIENSDFQNISINFNGGEPLLCFDKILYFVNSVENSSKNYNFSISTNGVLLNKEIFKIFKKYRFNVIVSCDGRKDSHLINRGRGDYKKDSEFYGKTIKNLILCKKEGVFTKINMVVSKENVKELSENYFFLQRLNPDFISISPVLRKIWEKEDLKILYRELKKIKNSNFSYKNVDDKINEILYVLGKINKFPDATFFTIDYDGKIYSDEFFDEKSKKYLYLEDIKNISNFKEIRKTDKNCFEMIYKEKKYNQDLIKSIKFSYRILLDFYAK